MKEVTYEEWQKNPTPRMMWVWDSDVSYKKKLKVIYYSNQDSVYPVITLTSDDVEIESFKHCAEIEKQRRMTKKELSRWLREKPTREFKYNNGCSVFCSYTYDENCGDEEVSNDIVIRENDSEWKEPLVGEIE